MKAPDDTSWRLHDGVSRADIEAALAPRFALEWRDGPASGTTYHDDADAALWHAGCLLSSRGAGPLVLTRGGAPVAEAAAGGARFWWDFPAGPLRDALRPLIGVRALLPVATQTLAASELLLFNEDRKIVVRASLTASRVDDQSMHYLTLKALRGYEAEYADACRILEGLLDARTDIDARALLERHRIPAFAPRPARTVSIDAAMPTEQAVRVMAHAMLASAQRHVGGVVADIDTEFLHLFRVGLRKTRSLVSLMKKALPEAAVARLRPRLSGIAGKTNRLRDLDVYLLAEHEYIALLPADFGAGMAELTALVRERRTAAQCDVAGYFSSSAFQADVDACLAELSLQPALATPAAARPVLPVVKRQMLKRYGALQGMSQLLHAGSADEDIHDLRIEFKKLRYLIEFFLDLLPRKRTLRLLADMKKIQGVLGAFNDLAVQIDFLNAFQDPARVEMTKALNGLTAVLHLKKVETRARIFDALGDYFTENRAIEFELVLGSRHQKEAA